MTHKIAVYAVVFFVGLFVGVLGNDIKPGRRFAMAPSSSHHAFTSTYLDSRHASAQELMTAGRLREAQDAYLQILTLAPGDRDALRDLITVRRLMAGQDAAKLQQQGEAYRQALANGTDTEEHYTRNALEILTMANFVAADQIRKARVTRARETEPVAGPITSVFKRVLRRGSRKANAVQPPPPQPVVSPPADPAVPAAPASGAPERSAPVPLPSLPSPTPKVIEPTPSNPAGAVSREPDQDLVSHPGGPPPAATGAGSQETGAQQASAPAPAAPPNPPAPGGTSTGNAAKTSGGSSAAGGGRLPLVPLYPNPKPRGDQ